MTFLPLNRPAATSAAATETAPLRALWALVKSLLLQAAPIDGTKAQRQNALRAEARANVDRLLR